MSSNLRIPSTAQLIRNSFFPLFRVYVYFLVLLPSGSVLGINVKAICFCLLLPGALLRFVESRRTSLVHVCLLFFVPASFLAWTLVSQAYGYDMSMAFSEYKDVFTTIASCWLAAVACSEEEESKISLLKTILNAEIAACVLKLLLLGYSFFEGTRVSVLVEAINHKFGVTLMTLDFEAALGRIQFIADGLIPICIYLLLRYRNKLRISTFSALLMFALLALSLIFTFSRFFWAFAALTFCLGMVVGKKDRFHGLLAVAFVITVAVSLPTLVDLYQLRFSTKYAGGSDNTRDEQIPPLVSFFRSAPFFGRGFGSHPQLIRSELPYVYEVQIYALAGQEGVIGLTWMALLMGLYFEPLWPRNRNTLVSKAFLLIILLVWLSAGLFNPMLLNSAAAMSYAAIRALAGVNESVEGVLAGRPPATKLH